MNSICVKITAVSIVCLRLFPVIASEDESVSRKFRQYERDIPSLYLLNGLYLTDDQAKNLSGIFDKAAEADRLYSRKLEKLLQSEEKRMEVEAGRMIDAVASGRKLKDASQDNSLTARKLREVRGEIGKQRGARREEMNELADKVASLLTASQKRIVENFTPCFIPPHDFRNPERVGQAVGDTSFTENILDRLRRAGGAGNTKALELAMGKLVPHVMEKRHIKYSKEAESDVRAELTKSVAAALEKMNGMTDADFELEKSSLAILAAPVPDTSSVLNPDATRWKICAYILNRGIEDVVKKRAGLKSSGPATGTDKPEDGKIRETVDVARTAAIFEGLKLSKEQAGRLLPIVKEAVLAGKKLEIDVAAAMNDACGPYENLRRELAEGQGTPKGEGPAGKCHGHVKLLRDEKTVEEMLKFEGRMDEILTADQVGYLASECPAMLRRKSEESEVIDDGISSAGRLLSAARKMSDLAFSKDGKRICSDFIRGLAGDGVGDGAIDAEKETARCLAVLGEARKLSGSDFNRKRADLAAELCPKRNKPRDPSYGARYIRGEPVKELSQSTRLLFSETSCNILEKIAAK